jgi:hypothetical protein
MKFHPASTDCKYSTLSYQWRKTSRLVALKWNVRLLSENGGIIEEDLPLTVRDAMRLCRDMGWQYLLVNALCIVQGDEESPTSHISCMRTIYLHADLTIVAAGGMDANAGLNSISSPRKASQHLEIVKGLWMVTAKPEYHLSVEEARWNSRAWTFQERMLSTRKLVFNEGQTFFECERGVWYEDVKMESDRMTLEKEVPFLHPPEKGSLPDGFPTYRDCVKEYTRRVLTYPEDILDGFAGIINHLKVFTDLGNRWSFGLPEQRLAEALLWIPAGGHYHQARWKCTESVNTESSSSQTGDYGVNRSHSKHLFPSWSWAGCSGAVSLLCA